MLLVSSATAVPIQGKDLIKTRLKRIKCKILFIEKIAALKDNFDNGLEFPDVNKLIDLEGFGNYFTSDKFVELIKDIDLQSLLESEEFLAFYDNQAVQKFINSGVVEILNDYKNQKEDFT